VTRLGHEKQEFPSVPKPGSDVVLIAATAPGRVIRRGQRVTHFSGGRVAGMRLEIGRVRPQCGEEPR
jgi:hypothetical protein